MSSTRSKDGGTALIPAVAGFILGSAVTAAAAAAAALVVSSGRMPRRHSRPRAEDEAEDRPGCSRRPHQCLAEGMGELSLPSSSLPPSIRDEQLSRNRLYFGPDGLSSITSARVCVVGLGGVGSHCAHMLARSGVRYLRLIDFDQITVSSLNRHACATLDDVGRAKATVLKSHLERICPDRACLEVDARVQMYTGDGDADGRDLLGVDAGEWDMVVDCIDDVPTKARLVAHCIRAGIRCVSCMGAGGKSDFTRLHVSDLRSASRDPLATKLRQCIKRLLKDKNDHGGNVGGDGVGDGDGDGDGESSSLSSYMDDPNRLAVVYSSEKTVVKLADFTDEQKQDGVHKYGAVDNMRIRVLPVLGTMPAIMGQSCAALVLCELGKKPFSPVAGERVGRNVRHRLFQHLKRREKKLRNELEATLSLDCSSGDGNGKGDGDGDGDGDGESCNGQGGVNRQRDDGRIIDGKWVGPTQIDGDDVEYLLAEVWRNRCAVTGDRLGTVLELVRWDMSRKSDCTNLVLMGLRAMGWYDDAAKEKGDGREGIPPDARMRIERRLATCQIDSNA